MKSSTFSLRIAGITVLALAPAINALATDQVLLAAAAPRTPARAPVLADEVVKAAMAAETVNRNGMTFPAANRSQSDGSCSPYDTQSFSGASIDIQGGYHAPQSSKFPDPAAHVIYSPANTEWLIQSYTRVLQSAGPPYYGSDSMFPAGYSFLSSGNYSSVSNTMHSIVANLNVSATVKANLDAQLNSMISDISSYAYSISGSHGSVEHTAQVTGTGVTNWNQGHAWYKADIEGVLVCSPTYLHDQAALESRLHRWIDAVVARLPREAVPEAVLTQ